MVATFRCSFLATCLSSSLQYSSSSCCLFFSSAAALAVCFRSRAASAFVFTPLNFFGILHDSLVPTLESGLGRAWERGCTTDCVTDISPMMTACSRIFYTSQAVCPHALSCMHAPISSYFHRSLHSGTFYLTDEGEESKPRYLCEVANFLDLIIWWMLHMQISS